MVASVQPTAFRAKLQTLYLAVLSLSYAIGQQRNAGGSLVTENAMLKHLISI